VIPYKRHIGLLVSTLSINKNFLSSLKQLFIFCNMYKTLSEFSTKEDDALLNPIFYQTFKIRFTKIKKCIKLRYDYNWFFKINLN